MVTRIPRHASTALAALVALVLFSFFLIHELNVLLRDETFNIPVTVSVSGIDADQLPQTQLAFRQVAGRMEVYTLDQTGTWEIRSDEVLTLLTQLFVRVPASVDASRVNVKVDFAGRSFVVPLTAARPTERIINETSGWVRLPSHVRATPAWFPVLGRMINLNLVRLLVYVAVAGICLIGLGLVVLLVTGDRPRFLLCCGGLILAIVVHISDGPAVVPALIATALAFALLLSGRGRAFDPSETQNGRAPSSRFVILLLGLLVLLAVLNIAPNLGRRDIFQDEVLHVEAALGLVNSGELVRWNLLYDVPSVRYTRNSVLTRMVAQSIHWFGLSEWSVRLPSALMGILGAFVVIAVAWWITRRTVVTLLVGYLYAVNDVLLYFSRFVRGYIFLLVLTFVSLGCAFRLATSRRARDAVLWLALCLLLFGLSVEFHATAVFQIPVVLTAMFIWVVRRYPVRNHPWVYAGVTAAAVFVATLALGLIPFLRIPFSPHRFVNLRPDWADFRTAYAGLLVQPFGFPWQLLFPAGIVLLRDANPKTRALGWLLAAAVWFPLISSAMFWDRYVDFRYIAFAQIPLMLMLALALVRAYVFVRAHTSAVPRPVVVGLIAVALLAIAPAQIPGIPPLGPFTRQAQVHWHNVEGRRIHWRAAQPDLHAAYEWIFSQGHPEFAIFRTPSEGINWMESLYLKRFLQWFPDARVVLYEQNRDGTVHERWHWDREFDELRVFESGEEVPLADNGYFVGTIRHNFDLVESMISHSAIDATPQTGAAAHTNGEPSVYVFRLID